ncbi:site-specific integrase [Luteirhabdus pelagi]|uniref:site-specific integrase n=1 Tax=Luteirhabdus pelagi TaxID=2792783 RepID=UPI001939BF7C|nr:site-specific integrase [Luteirhabdus pelagi]
MRTRSTFSINFWINTSRSTNGQAKLYARITINSKRTNLSLKYTIPAEDWDSKTSSLKPRSPNAKEVNDYLSEVHSDLYQCYRDLRSENKTVTSEMVKLRYFGEDGPHKTLEDLFEYHNENEEHKISPSTLSHYRTTQKYLRSYVKKSYKRNEYLVEQVDHKFLVGFETFLKGIYPKDRHVQINNNGAMKHLQRLRKMIYMALSHEWIEKNPFSNFKIKMKKNEREFLSEGELEKISLYKTKVIRLRIVRDLFLFSCYTGLAYCDLMGLKDKQIVIGIDKKPWIVTSRKKTNNGVRVPLLPKALAILEKYQGHPNVLEGRLLPQISNQKLNSYLKEIADACYIEKELTFHMARHTFATTVTLSNGVPIETVSKMLGHTKLATTQIYARVLDLKVANDMKILRDKLR